LFVLNWLNFESSLLDIRQMFGEMEAIDSLLQQLAYYKRHDPNQVEVGPHEALPTLSANMT
jgi:hypothetical protein